MTVSELGHSKELELRKEDVRGGDAASSTIGRQNAVFQEVQPSKCGSVARGPQAG